MPDWLDQILSSSQQARLTELEGLALHFNGKLNLYSKDSVAQFNQRHILHSLVLASHPFPEGAHIVDWGTGGGMPGLPLAIAFPESTFHLIDAVGKKIDTVSAMARRLGLQNVRTYHCRAEQWEGETHYSVSRATSSLATLWEWHNRVSVPLDTPPTYWQPGLLCLKGGSLGQEEEDLHLAYPNVNVNYRSLLSLLDDSYFASKKLVEMRG